jgi:hypothetical protein
MLVSKGGVMEKWQRIDFEFCPECSGNIEVFTMADDNQCYDSDSARCEDCPFQTVMSVDESGVAWLQEVDCTRNGGMSLERAVADWECHAGWWLADRSAERKHFYDAGKSQAEAQIAEAGIKKELGKVKRLLRDAFDHLEYCGYGDSWERECAEGLKKELTEYFKES